MNWLERHFGIFPEPDLVLYVGAGQGAELPMLAALGDARIVLVEPHPRWAESLRQRAENYDNVEVLECALDENTGTATLNVFNLPDMSSLRTPGELESLLPGLKQQAEVSVTTRTLPDLLARLGVEPGAGNWLIVDVPGIGKGLLSGLQDREVRRSFPHVVVRAGREAWFEGDLDQDALLEDFAGLGYRTLGSPDATDGDWPRFHLVRFARSRKRRELEATIDALKQRVGQLAEEKTESERQLEQSRRDLEQKIAHLGQEFAERHEQEQQRLLELSREFENSRLTLEAAKQEQLSKNEALHAQLQSRDDEVARLSGEVHQWTERFRELEAQIQNRAQRVQELEASLSAAREQVEHANSVTDEQRKKHEGELERLRSDLSVALRVQALRDADLKELQERYGQLVEQRDQQHDLLVQLARRLGSASEFLKQLNAPDGQHPPGDSAVAEGLTRALSGDLDN